jgi:hypothetical protein
LAVSFFAVLSGLQLLHRLAATASHDRACGSAAGLLLSAMVEGVRLLEQIIAIKRDR